LLDQQTVTTPEFYPRTDGKPWELKYDDAVKALNQAKQRLMGSQGNET